MPEQPSTVDRVRSLVTGHAQLLSGDLASVPDPPRPETAVVSDQGWTVLVVAVPTPPGAGVPDLTECERDCIAVLMAADGPRSGVRVHRLLKRANAFYGLATVKRALARLKRLGILTNSRRAPQGYAVAGDFPLFRRPATS
jgi:hypothetical protein